MNEDEITAAIGARTLAVLQAQLVGHSVGPDTPAQILAALHGDAELMALLDQAMDLSPEYLLILDGPGRV